MRVFKFQFSNFQPSISNLRDWYAFRNRGAVPHREPIQHHGLPTVREQPLNGHTSDVACPSGHQNFLHGNLRLTFRLVDEGDAAIPADERRGP